MNRNAPPKILSGWKEIASYMGMGVRTVQRYERTMGLPVRRPAGKSRGSVISTTAELDAWISASPLIHSFPLRQTVLNVSVLDAFKRNLAEHQRLCTQLSEMREEFHTSMEMLRASLKAVCDSRYEDDLHDNNGTSSGKVN